jgi:hypothetical protein
MVEEKRSSGLRFPASLRHLPGKRTASVGYPRVAYPAVVTFVGQVAGCAGIDVAGIVLIHGSACFISGRTGPKKGGVEQEKSLYRSKRCFRESGPTEERGGNKSMSYKNGIRYHKSCIMLAALFSGIHIAAGGKGRGRAPGKTASGGQPWNPLPVLPKRRVTVSPISFRGRPPVCGAP